MVTSISRLISQDLERYCVLTGKGKLHALIAHPGAQATLVYRLGNYLYSQHEKYPRILLLACRQVYRVVSRLSEITTGISINPTATIGPGLYIGHFGGVIVGSDVVIGSNCNLSQGVTIGVGGRGHERGAPQLGNRVYVAPGAKVFGKIVIGDDVAIGANAVVTKSLEESSVAVGVPAEITSRRGSFEFVKYYHMESDLDRQRNFEKYGGGEK